MRIRHVGGVLAVITVALLAAGCAVPTSPTTAPTPTEHNAADVAFAQGMVPHHQQALVMAAPAAQRAAVPEVRDLATQIGREQGPEIEQMNQMLAAWGAPPPPAGSMGPMPMHGMMSAEQLQLLGAQSGPAFDRMFLQMMIEHHTGAVQMAQTEQAQGLDRRAVELAGAIVLAQQREIAEMQNLLARV
ncbi:hypothetical protein Acsp06_44380 [Actinomycetospora sp. NBRC 106375]|uniref:DUF305 domain-containing protein n=1 Tax=Actinomycetospora sp. NBRC 106375 TaxID=3032207 RepID=UPI0024A123A6|nr:DUF305 domain-containing protein [Actinomycetospora sp. NBRC 106375]GLZ48253.1 hypothetical protein Acsp06_44380 [Actinomycetospora sp. NBRC 106375]